LCRPVVPPEIIKNPGSRSFADLLRAVSIDVLSPFPVGSTVQYVGKLHDRQHRRRVALASTSIDAASRFPNRRTDRSAGSPNNNIDAAPPSAVTSIDATSPGFPYRFDTLVVYLPMSFESIIHSNLIVVSMKTPRLTSPKGSTRSPRTRGTCLDNHPHTLGRLDGDVLGRRRRPLGDVRRAHRIMRRIPAELVRDHDRFKPEHLDESPRVTLRTKGWSARRVAALPWDQQARNS
jgi:hypothetical protein